ncbi:MarR family winged helix-turn-helix transcriptional regulator [Deinococcus roseus]|uniref:MarR family transcriptional regulator n=1 Tax=Deinococcus roseus TaxID=392414 RepID=A0ABQ2DD80_9DEIO|nr:MarR family transcriptional regulator [Deinococcus roseus]GGJ51650.1 MarR family transcriptional regulator [Deinococcus roseus]
MTPTLQDLGRSIKQVQYRHHRLLDQQLKTIHTTLSQWDALRAIGNNPDAPARKLAQLTFQTDQAFGELSSRLLAQGLITRTAGPGRAIRHRLTAAGEALLQAGYHVVMPVLQASFAPLNEQEREVLYSLLQRMLENENNPLK